jgi:hypothetical protein
MSDHRFESLCALRGRGRPSYRTTNRTFIFGSASMTSQKVGVWRGSQDRRRTNQPAQSINPAAD